MFFLFCYIQFRKNKDENEQCNLSPSNSCFACIFIMQDAWVIYIHLLITFESKTWFTGVYFFLCLQ